MPWFVRLDGSELDSDDLTVAELAEIERLSGTPWSIANPLRTMAVAKAYLRVLLIRAGDEDADATIDALTLGRIKRAFDYRAEDGEVLSEVTDGESDPPTSSPSSSAGGRNGTGGRRRSSVPSASGTA